jgi:transposase
MCFVRLKSEAQLEMQILHRARARLVTDHTALINQRRALLLERVIEVARGRSGLRSTSSPFSTTELSTKHADRGRSR